MLRNLLRQEIEKRKEAMEIMNLMKVRSLSLFCALLLALGGFAAPLKAEAETYKKLSIGGSFMTGMGFTTAVGYIQAGKKALPGATFNIVETAGLVGNTKGIAGGDFHAGLDTIWTAWRVLNKQPGFENKKYDATVMTVQYPPYISVMMTACADKKGWTLRDLNGKPCSLQLEGSISRAMMKEVFNILKIKPIEKNMQHGNAVGALIDGTIVAHAATNYIPVMEELAARKGVYLIPPHPDDLKILLEKLPWLTGPFTLKSSEWYRGANDILTVGNVCTWLVRSDLPDDLVYKWTKGVFENIKIMKAAYAPLAKMEPNLIKYVKTKNLIHPGAAKYYKETGINIRDELIYKGPRKY
jgi:TRAP transporter TAXI family solute receptor